MKIAVAASLATLLLAASAAAAHAETVTLADGTQVNGDLVRADAKGVDLKTADGKKLHLDKAKVRAIRFGDGVAAASPRAIYGTPEATIDTWRKAAIAADDAGMIEAYASPYQAEVKHELDAMNFVDREQLLADVGATSFDVKNVAMGKDEATVTVAQTKDGETRTGDLHLVLENGEWKMTP